VSEYMCNSSFSNSGFDSVFQKLFPFINCSLVLEGTNCITVHAKHTKLKVICQCFNQFILNIDIKSFFVVFFFSKNGLSVYSSLTVQKYVLLKGLLTPLFSYIASTEPKGDCDSSCKS
jgi:hypothetical protein